MCSLCDVVSSCRSGRHPLQIADLAQTVVILGDNQGARGWCVAVLKEHVEHMDALPIDRQAAVFSEVAAVARAVRQVFTDSAIDGNFVPPRINYECLGNVVPHVHWHVVPRHADDPTPTAPVWGWSQEALKGAMSQDERQSLAERLRAAMIT
jgi:diadenosine tetraphosphate (Ap4A) HIT family hydrolase